MEKIFKFSLLTNAGLRPWRGLAFLLLYFIASCDAPERPALSLLWENNKATAILIPSMLIDMDEVSVHVAGSGSPVLGDLTEKNDTIQFRPLIPLSPGMTYEVWQQEQPVVTITVPKADGNKPLLLTIYPESDTLPENLLKFYLHFDHPMRTGEVLQHVHLLDAQGDTLPNIFLNLQPELWDTSGTTLTLWLDPGRIKRGLALNRALGNPLTTAQHYRLVVSANWKDSRGLPLAVPYTKKFLAGVHDGTMIDMSRWQLSTPRPGTREPLTIYLHEALDHYLLTETVSVQDAQGNEIAGVIKTADRDQQWTFTPGQNWPAGTYQLTVQARLEDLAGNNLNKVFDRDVRADEHKDQAFFMKGFEIK